MPTVKLTSNKAKIYASLKHKKYRRQHNLFIADGAHMVKEAIKSGWPLETVMVSSENLDLADKLKVPRDKVTIATAQQFNRVSPSKSPQGILAILKITDRSNLLPNLLKSAKSLIGCDNISDPGNLGTIIRTAAALSFDSVILIGHCADIYNPKTVTATQGALFNIPVIEIKSPAEFIDTFAEPFKLISLSGNYSDGLSQAPRIDRPLVIVGGETSGISQEIETASHYRFRIEQSNKVDSLNASVAAAIAMYMLHNR